MARLVKGVLREYSMELTIVATYTAVFAVFCVALMRHELATSVMRAMM